MLFSKVAFFRQSVNARKCSTKAPQRLSNAFNYFKPANSLWLKAYFTIRAAFFHVCGASGGLVFFLFFFFSCSVCRHELSVMGLSRLSPVHFSPSELCRNSPCPSVWSLEWHSQCSAVPHNFLKHTVPHETRPGGEFWVYFQKKSLLHWLSLPQLWIIFIYSCTVR